MSPSSRCGLSREKLDSWVYAPGYMYRKIQSFVEPGLEGPCVTLPVLLRSESHQRAPFQYRADREFRVHVGHMLLGCACIHSGGDGPLGLGLFLVWFPMTTSSVVGKRFILTAYSLSQREVWKEPGGLDPEAVGVRCSEDAVSLFRDTNPVGSGPHPRDLCDLCNSCGLWLCI